MNIINIITNTPVSSLAIPNNELTHTTMGKIDKSRPVILVDTSYWLYYRYFALRTWYKKAFPDSSRSENFDIEHNWLEDTIFINKFCYLFIENIKKIVRKYGTIMSNVVFCIDCSFKDIWRNAIITEYKATRPELLKKKGFNAFNVFNYVKKEYLPKLQVQYGIKICYHSRCEADDIIGHFAPFLIAHGVPMVYVVANDNDYLQICNSRIKMIKGGLLPDSSSNYPYPGEQYLIRKILQGDVSDNIRGCSINKVLLEKNIHNIGELNATLEEQIYKTVSRGNIETLLMDDTRYEFFSQLLDAIRKGDIKDANDGRLLLIRNFYENSVLMDFKMIPKDILKELEIRFASYM